MSWFPISKQPVQYYNPLTNVPYSGAVLKAYAAGTTTNINFATDSTGGTQISSVALNSNGYPESSGTVIIPHIDRDFKVALYPDQASADTDTGAVIPAIDNISINDYNSSYIATGGSSSRPIEDKIGEFLTPKDFGAVGDGATDDTISLQSACTAVGEDGVLYNDGATYLITDRTLVQCSRIGEGYIKIGSDLHPWATDAKNIQQNSFTPFSNSTVDATDYSHFPCIDHGKDGRIGLLYFQGQNHGQADLQGVCLDQAVGAASSLTINGNYASGGSVTLGAETRIGITSDANDSGVTFTITGSQNGNPKIHTVTGVNSNTVYTTTAELFDVITSVASDGACSGTISVGTFVNPSNISFKYSDDGMYSWSSRQELFDGLTTGAYYYYYPCFGSTREGYFIAIALKIDIATNSAGLTSYTIVRRISKDNGVTWDSESTVSFSGFTPSSTLTLYSNLKHMQDGTLYASAYSGDDNFFLTSTDEGKNWAGTVIVNSSSPNYDETAIEMIDHRRGIGVSRITGSTSSMRQFRTTDGGVSWTDLGDLNNDDIIPASGGYVSPFLTSYTRFGEKYLLLAIMARDSASSPVTYPDTLYLTSVKAETAILNNDKWEYETLIEEGNLVDRSGYPSIYVNPQTTECAIAYGVEAGTGTKEATVKTIKYNINSIKTRNNIIKLRGSTTTDTSDETYASDTILKYTRQGNIGQVEFQIALATKGSSTPLAGNIYIDNLPFRFESTNIGVTSCFANNRDASITGQPIFGRGVAGLNQLQLFHSPGVSDSNVIDTEISGTFEVRGAISMLIDE